MKNTHETTKSLYILEEQHLSRLPDYQVPSQGEGSHCDYIIHDPELGKVHFYTRFAGANLFCKKLEKKKEIEQTSDNEPEEPSSNEIEIPSKIPKKLWISSKNLDNDKYGINLEKTKEAFMNKWKTDNLDIQILNESFCHDSIFKLPIKGASTYLLDYHIQYRQLQNYDLCAIVVLYLHGGYFLGEKLEVIEPYKPLNGDISFVGVLDAGAKQLFIPTFLGATAENPILFDILIKYMSVRKGFLRLRQGGNTVGEIWRLGYNSALAKESEENKQTVSLLVEENIKYINDISSTLLPESRSIEACNYVIHDDSTEPKFYFYSRFPGSGNFCP